MDANLLAARGIAPSDINTGFVEDYELCIGERATLARRSRSRVYGVVMEIASGAVTELYAEDSVADYVPESVTVELMDGSKIDATCYSLPDAKPTGANKAYADALLNLATNLGFPGSYLEQIKKASK